MPLIIIGLFVLIIVYVFVSRKASPIPYFPSNKKDIKKIVNALDLTNNQVVYDLGAGDGIVIFSAASEASRKKLNTSFVAVEINPVLFLILHLRRLFHPNRGNIRIINTDIFSMRYKLHITRYKKITLFAYVSPWYLVRIYKNAAVQIKKFSFISYFYPVPNQRSSRTIKGVHTTYVYNT